MDIPSRRGKTESDGEIVRDLAGNSNNGPLLANILSKYCQFSSFADLRTDGATLTLTMSACQFDLYLYDSMLANDLPGS